MGAAMVPKGCASAHQRARTHAFAAPGLALLCVVAGGQGQAQVWGGALGVASDHLERGYSLTAGRPAWLADLHYGFGTDWVVGLGAGADRSPRQSAGTRLNLYIDRRWRLGEDWAAKVGIARYDSPGNNYRALVRYDELNAAIGWRGRWRASLALSPDVAGSWNRVYRHGPAAWLELDYHQPLAGRLALDVGAGHAWLSEAGLADYTYGNAGFGYGIGDVHLYLAWQWNDRAELPYGVTSEAWSPMQEPSEWVVSALWVF
jgi:uncharacterized protein (TIGR02001 family)